MAQFVVRNVEDEVKRRLRTRAARHGRSTEEEVREILRDAVKDEGTSVGGLGTEISSLFSKVGLETDIAELRGHEIEPASFER